MTRAKRKRKALEVSGESAPNRHPVHYKSTSKQRKNKKNAKRRKSDGDGSSFGRESLNSFRPVLLPYDEKQRKLRASSSTLSTPSSVSTPTKAKRKKPWQTSSIQPYDEEIRDFRSYLKPTNQEIIARWTVFSNLQKLVQMRWPHAILKLFGSAYSSLSTFRSDLDVHIIGIEGDTTTVDHELIDLTQSKPQLVRVREPVGKTPTQTSFLKTMGFDKPSNYVRNGSLVKQTPFSTPTVNVEQQSQCIIIDSDDEDMSSMSINIFTSSSPASSTGNKPGNNPLRRGRSGSKSFSVRMDTGAVCSSPTSKTNKKDKKLAVKRLHKLARLLRDTGKYRVEVRSRARVPIIALVHIQSNISVDINVGQSTEDTTSIIKEIATYYSQNFIPIIMVLKEFLHQLKLDKPFTGGIGSFKLYAMLAFALEKYYDEQFSKSFSASITRQTSSSLWRQLMFFFQLYGTTSLLAEASAIVIGTEKGTKYTADLTTIRLLRHCVEAFRRAYHIMSMREDSRDVSTTTEATSFLADLIHSNKLSNARENSERSAKTLTEKDGDGKVSIEEGQISSGGESPLEILELPKAPHVTTIIE